MAFHNVHTPVVPAMITNELRINIDNILAERYVIESMILATYFFNGLLHYSINVNILLVMIEQ